MTLRSSRMIFHLSLSLSHTQVSCLSLSLSAALITLMNYVALNRCCCFPSRCFPSPWQRVSARHVNELPMRPSEPPEVFPVRPFSGEEETLMENACNRSGHKDLKNQPHRIRIVSESNALQKKKEKKSPWVHITHNATRLWLYIRSNIQ